MLNWFVGIMFFILAFIASRASKLDELLISFPNETLQQILKRLSSSNKSDKFEMHRYTDMYGRHLIPVIEHRHKNNMTVKMLEIGLGCNMKYFSGVKL